MGTVFSVAYGDLLEPSQVLAGGLSADASASPGPLPSWGRFFLPVSVTGCQPTSPTGVFTPPLPGGLAWRRLQSCDYNRPQQARPSLGFPGRECPGLSFPGPSQVSALSRCVPWDPAPHPVLSRVRCLPLASVWPWLSGHAPWFGVPLGFPSQTEGGMTSPCAGQPRCAGGQRLRRSPHRAQ